MIRTLISPRLRSFFRNKINIGSKPGALSDTVMERERSPLTSPPIPTSTNGTSRLSFRVNSSI
ncbi:unnamed protein product, partial [Brassica rapa subsp. narinosa]